MDMLNTDGGHIIISIFMILIGTILVVQGWEMLGMGFITAFISVLTLVMKSTGKANGVAKPKPDDRV